MAGISEEVCETTPAVERDEVVGECIAKPGQLFESIEHIDAFIKQVEEQEGITYYRRDSKMLRRASLTLKRPINPDLKYYRAIYCCIKGGRKFQSRSRGERSVSSFKLENPCPSSLTFTVSKCGQYLELKEAKMEHNHEIFRDTLHYLPKRTRETEESPWNNKKYTKIVREVKCSPSSTNPATTVKMVKKEKVKAGIGRWAGKVAFVTGVSSGSGFEIAKKLLKNKMTVIGCARNMENLEEAQNRLVSAGFTSIHTYVCDVSNEQEIIATIEDVNQRFVGIDVLVNNAGLARPSPLLTGDTNDWKTMFDVNVLGLMTVTKHAVQSMKKKGSSECHIININSQLGHQVFNNPENHVYGATKYALDAVTQGLRFEILNDKSFNCRVSQVSQALTRTNFKQNQYDGDKKRAIEVYSKFRPLDAENVADCVIFQLTLPSHAQVGDISIRSVEAPN